MPAASHESLDRRAGSNYGTEVVKRKQPEHGLSSGAAVSGQLGKRAKDESVRVTSREGSKRLLLHAASRVLHSR